MPNSDKLFFTFDSHTIANTAAAKADNVNNINVIVIASNIITPLFKSGSYSQPSVHNPVDPA
jgi:hypothetical protein